jgi:hypothetical protein
MTHVAHGDSTAAGRQQAVTDAEARVLSSMREIVDAYTEIHAGIAASHPDVTTGDDTLEAGAWELTGRCLSLANALLALLDAGYVVQSSVMHRALFETSSVLAAVATPAEEDLRIRWLADQSVPHASALRAIERFERRIVEAGLMAPPSADLRQRVLFERTYRLLSSDTHAQRSQIRKSVLPAGFAYGTESQWLDRAATIFFAAASLAWMIAPSLNRGLAACGEGEVASKTADLAQMLAKQSLDVLAAAMRERLSDDAGPSSDSALSSS